jgi:hypothetical protein
MALGQLRQAKVKSEVEKVLGRPTLFARKGHVPPGIGIDLTRIQR